MELSFMMTELGFPNKNRVAILAELDKEKRKLLLQNQSSTNNPGASIALSRPNVNKDFRDRAEQQHIAAQQKAALQVKPFSQELRRHCSDKVIIQHLNQLDLKYNNKQL